MSSQAIPGISSGVYGVNFQAKEIPAVLQRAPDDKETSIFKEQFAKSVSSVERLKLLRSFTATCLTTLQEAKAAAKVNDKCIPFFGIVYKRSNESKQLLASEKALTSYAKELDALDKSYAKVKGKFLAATLPAAKEVSNQALKQNMPEVARISINGNKQNSLREVFANLFATLGIELDDVRINARVDKFGTKAGNVADNIIGRDLDVLKVCNENRFADMADALQASCKQVKYLRGNQCLTPAENVTAREYYISKQGESDVTVQMKTVYSLTCSQENEEVATVVGTYTVQLNSDGKVTSSNCRFDRITPNANIRAYHFDKLDRIFNEKDAIEAPAAVTAN